MLFKKIETTVNSLKIESVSEERKETLQSLIDFIQFKANDNQEIRLTLFARIIHEEVIYHKFGHK